MENTINYQTIGQAMLAKKCGTFVNDKGEYCHISRFYIKNTEKFQIIFKKDLMSNDTASRPAINTTSEKKILKLLNTEKFKLI